MKHDHKIMDELCNYLGEDLDSPMCMELKEHVDNCQICQDYIKSMKGTVMILKKMQEEKKVPETLVNNILQKIKEKKNG
ncbi:MAG: hypothetical protein Kow00108_05190 [Calditrichia bacterium]